MRYDFPQLLKVLSKIGPSYFQFGQFTYSGFLVYTRRERGLSTADQNIHPPFELIPESVHESWNCSSTANEFGLKMKELYIVVHEKVCFFEG